jgi:cytochrome P450
MTQHSMADQSHSDQATRESSVRGMAITADAYDPLAPEYLDDPQIVVQPILAQTPVFYHPPLNCYVVMRHGDVRAVFNAVETFSSASYKAIPPPPHLRDRVPVQYERVAQVIIGGGVLNMDPPDHTKERRTAQRTFTHPGVASATGEFEQKADALIDEFIDRGSCDLMQEFAYRLTLSVVGEILGRPQEHLPRFHAWIGEASGL